MQLTKILLSSKTVVHTEFSEGFGSPGKKFIVIYQLLLLIFTSGKINNKQI